MKKINVEKYKLSEDKLIDFGFQFEENILVFQKNILNDAFRMEIRLVSTDFEIEIYDLDFNEVYSLFSVDSASGEIVTAIREEVKDVLEKILCLESVIYENVLRYVKERYNSTTVKPFKTNPDIKALVTIKNKWYALFLDVEYSKLQKDSLVDSKVKIINLKHLSSEISTVINNRNVFPAYHMNKNHWISVVLDNNIDIEYVKELIELSYNLVNNK
ncbi:MmcQ/YjbR family DNA-binding protein [Gemella sp. 27098_8_92]|uniref:MmcQ/YjbR family DNA-binding protein n=1 Tax=Gemella sp. 27098_8_92 TaxID=3003687 RepID=UPI00352D2AA3